MSSAFFGRRHFYAPRQPMTTAIWGLPVVAAIGIKASVGSQEGSTHMIEPSIAGYNRIVRDTRPGPDSGLHAPAVERRAWTSEHLKTDGGHSRHYRSTTAGTSNRDGAAWSFPWRSRAYRASASEHDHWNPPATREKGLLQRERDRQDNRRIRLRSQAAARGFVAASTGTVESAVTRALTPIPKYRVRHAREVLSAIASALADDRAPAARIDHGRNNRRR